MGQPHSLADWLFIGLHVGHPGFMCISIAVSVEARRPRQLSLGACACVGSSAPQPWGLVVVAAQGPWELQQGRTRRGSHRRGSLGLACAH